jgi:hypothetical protein
MTASTLTPAEPARRVRPTGYCTRCRRTKPRAEFWPNAKIRTGLSSWCKDCARDARRASREKYRDRYNAERRKPRQERSCAECGERFVSSIPHKLYCGAKCKKRAENRRVRSKEKVA